MPNLYIQPEGVLSAFYKITPGRELEATKDLDNRALFKALGEYDLVTFELVSPLLESVVNKRYMSSTHSIKSFQWAGNEYETPELVEWVSDALLLGFISIEVDKRVFERGIELHPQLIEKLEHLPRADQDEIAILGGLGHHDVYLLYKTSNFDSLFEYLQSLRTLEFNEVFSIDPLMDGDDEPVAFSALTDTKCVPLISYKNIISPNKFDVIEGSVIPFISIHCPPGFEPYVIEKLRESDLLDDPESEDNKYFLAATLGTYDLVVTTHGKKINASGLVKNLLDFRSAWSQHDHLQFSTTTQLFGSQKIKPVPSYFIKSPEFEHYDEVDPRFTSLQPHLFSKIKSLMQRYTSVLTLHNFSLAARDVDRLPDRILGEVLDYLDVYEYNHESSNEHLTQIVDLIESSTEALSQRIQGDIYPAEVVKGSSSYHGGGELSSLLAIHLFIDSLINLSVEGRRSEKWTGCAYYNDSVGYALKTGSIFCVPHAAMHEPFLAKCAWRILTHEISHYIFINRNTSVKEVTLVVDQIIKRTVDLYGGMDVEREKERAESIYFELWATWFDYYHFYKGDLDRFQESIWEGWLGVTIFFEDPNEYVFRAFSVFLLSEEHRFINGFIKGDQPSDIIHLQWIGFCKYITNLMGNKKLDEIIAEVENEVCVSCSIYMPVVAPIFSSVKDEDLRKEIFSEYENLQDHIDKIKSSTIVTEEIENPYLLYYSLQSWVSQENPETFGPSIALIKSFEHMRYRMTSED